MPLIKASVKSNSDDMYIFWSKDLVRQMVE